MKMEEVPQEVTKDCGEEVILTHGERRILKKLMELEKLWKVYGKNLTFHNGDTLMYLLEKENRPACWSDTIWSFPYIKGEGGDPDVYPEEEN